MTDATSGAPPPNEMGRAPHQKPGADNTNAASLIAFDRLLDALADRVVRSNQVTASARCPAHDDSNPSLSVRASEGRVLLYCHAGCATVDVLAALELTTADLFDNPNGVDYRYDNGRVVHRTPDKKFFQRGTNKPPELYRLSKVKAAVAAGKTVFVAEGEDDVHALESIGVTATCSPMGAGKWSKVDRSPLHGAAKVVIIADRDKVGAQHASDVWTSLKDHVGKLEVVQARSGKDAADHIAAGLGVDDFAAVDPAARTGARQLRLTPASQITVRPVHWLWQDRAPLGSITLIGGREGIGKSTPAYDLAAQITRGTLPGRYHGIPKAVIVAATEDSWEHTIVPRLMAAGADLTRVYRVDVTTSEDVHTELSLPRDVIALERLVRDVDAALVLLDPLMSRLDAALDTHKDSEVRLGLEPVVAIADATLAAVLGLIHVNKGTSGDPLTMLMGSRAFAAVARAVLFVMVDPEHEDQRLLGQPKNNLGRTDTLPTLTFTIETVTVADTDEGPVITGRLLWGQESATSIIEALAAAADTDRTATSEAADWLTDYLTDNGGTADSADIKRDGHKAGDSADALKRARRRVKATYASYGSPRRTRWELPGTQVEHPVGATSGETALTALTAPTQQIRGVPSMACSNQSEQSEQSEQLSPGTPPQLEPSHPNGKCTRCGCRLGEWLIAQGETVHPGCADLCHDHPHSHPL